MRISDWSSDVCSSDLVAGLLGGNFPVLRRIHGDERWQALVHAFYRDHDSRTPLFTELAREFLRYLDARDEDPAMPWLRELAHYEWAGLALQISEAHRDDISHHAHGAPGARPGPALPAG